jgi:formyl-CoA transferase
VHTSLLEAQIAMLDFQATRWLIGHEVPPQAGNDHPTGMPTGVLQTTDGYINIAASGDHMYKRLCIALGCEEMVDDPKYKTGRDRATNRRELMDALEERTKHRSSAEWIELLNEQSVPAGPIYRIDETWADPQVQHLQIARPVEHPKLGHMDVLGQAMTLEGGAGRPGVRRPTPGLGEHTEEVLGSIGYGADEVAALREKGAI